MSDIERARDLYQQGALDQAIALLQNHLGLTSSDLDGQLLLGVCLARSKRTQEAIQVFRTLLVANPECYEALTWMGVLLKNRREVHEAIEFAKRAIELQPQDASGYSVLGGCFLYLRQSEPALVAFQKARSIAPNVAENEHNLGLVHQIAHQHAQAIQHFKQAIKLAPRSPQSYLALSTSYSTHGMYGPAIDALAEGLAQVPNSAALNMAAGAAFTMIRNDTAAERHYQKALTLSEASKPAYAAWLLNQGRFADSSAIYEQLLNQRPPPAIAYYGIMQSKKLTALDTEFLQEMESQLQRDKLGPMEEMHLHYAIGKAQDQIKRFESAMAHYDEANRLAYEIHNAGAPFDIHELGKENDDVIRTYEAVQEQGQSSANSNAPIFIVGMIRSGTTLLDQILSSHPQVTAAGELRFWIEEALRLSRRTDPVTPQVLEDVAQEYVRYTALLAESAERITDKMPLNYAYLGIIHQALPKAKFIHIRRHPVDTCLSIYTTYFGQGPLFAYRKSHIVDYYREYLRMMEYWRSNLPADRLLELDYETLISAPQALIPRIIEFCGLPWDEACLHHDQNQSAINTPSRWQARQPMYKTSLERWRSYEPWLGNFSSLLPASLTQPT